LNPVRVLVVDDDNSRRAYLVQFLSEQGFDVKEADGIDTALVQVDQGWPEVMVLDMQMPNPHGDSTEAGLAVMRALVDRRERPGVVVFTADLASPSTEAARELEAVAVIDKAVNLDKLPRVESLGWQICAAWQWRRRWREARSAS
jgi:CheY-like chemotaxis protein